MADLNLLPQDESRTSGIDWLARATIAVLYLAFGLEKFSSSPDSHWVILFRQIHLGDWFRYVTGMIEVVAAILVLIPRAAIFGLLLLACTMFGATLIVAVVLHQPGEAVFPGILFLILAAMTWSRTRAGGADKVQAHH